MLKKSASFVLASLRSSTLKRAFRRPEAPAEIFHSPRSIIRANGFTKCGPYLLASSLAAALLDGLFEHPETISTSTPYGDSIDGLCIKRIFQQSVNPNKRLEKPCFALSEEGEKDACFLIA
jgi:hypothetical protein